MLECALRKILLFLVSDFSNLAFIKNVREHSFLTLGTRAEDNFTQSGKISYSILDIEKLS